MLRRIASSSGCLLLVSLVIGCHGTETGTQTQQDKDAMQVQGAWDFVAGESHSGRGGVSGEHITFSGESFTNRSGGIKFSAVFSMDSAKSPKQIDFKHAIGSIDPGTSFPPPVHRNMPGIYEIDGNAMRICIDESGMKRPNEFVGSGANVVIILKRK